MTNKVVSLSSGLVLGMVCAFFLGIGSTQNVMPSSSFELPFNFEMTIAQHPHSTEQHVPEQEAVTTPSVTPSIDSAEPSSGRITRIATLTVTENPISNHEEQSTKIHQTTTVPDNPLYRANQQRSFIATNSTTESMNSSIILVTAKQSNFTSIADNSTGRNTGTTTSPEITDKPQTAGSPALAHNDPCLFGDHQEPPVITGKDNKPEAEMSSGNTSAHISEDSNGDDNGGRHNRDSNYDSIHNDYPSPRVQCSNRQQFN